MYPPPTHVAIGTDRFIMLADYECIRFNDSLQYGPLIKSLYRISTVECHAIMLFVTCKVGKIGEKYKSEIRDQQGFKRR